MPGEAEKDSSKTQKGGEQAEVNPLDVKEPAKPEESGVIESIVTTETAEAPERILEEAPEFDVALLKEVAPPKSLLLLLLKIVFGILVVASFASILFFTSQLSSVFDFATSTFGVPNISNELKSSNEELITFQTDLNFYRYLQMKAALDEFSYYGDSYIKNYENANSQTVSDDVKLEADNELVLLRDYLRESYLIVKENIVLDFALPLVDEEFQPIDDTSPVFEEELTSKLQNKAEEFAGSDDSQAKREFKNYTHTQNLVGNNSLKSLIVGTDFDALSDKELYKFIKDINSVIVNDLSILQEIKDMRIKWSDIMNEIDLRTMAVDTFYSENFYEEIGGIQYTSYEFDSSGPTISITGETKRFDTTNFTMIVNLIDEFNRSELFENAGMSSFSKSGSTDTGYTASLKLTLDLQTEESAQDSEISLEETPEFFEPQT